MGVQGTLVFAGAIAVAGGFVVVAPDYIGLPGLGDPTDTPHGLAVGEQIAIGSWDALRAGLRLLDGDLGAELEDVVIRADHDPQAISTGVLRRG